MKTAILVFASLLIGGSVYAQTDTTKINEMPSDELPVARPMQVDSNSVIQYNAQEKDLVSNQNEKQKKQDGVYMEGGKMMMISKGITSALNREIKMANGTKVYTDGTYVLLNGTKNKFKNGDQMNMNGDLTQLK